MRRLFWTAFGATVGVLAVRRVTRAAESLTPTALAQSVSASLATLGDAFVDFADQVREGMAEREAQLRADLGLDGDPRPALEASPARLPLTGPPSDRRPGGRTDPNSWTGRHP